MDITLLIPLDGAVAQEIAGSSPAGRARQKGSLNKGALVNSEHRGCMLFLEH